MLVSVINLKIKVSNLNGSAPANNESAIVFPTQAAGVHVGPQTDVVPQHICDPLFGAEVVDFDSLKESKI